MFQVKSILRRRVVQCALLVVALTAGWSASAAALPPLPPPPITLPTLTLPTVTVSSGHDSGRDDARGHDADGALPPRVPPAPKAPRVTLPAVPPPPSVLHGDTAGDPGPAGAGRSANESQQGARAETSREQASRLRLARDWISRRGPHGERRTTLVFILRRPALVEFVVLQVAPDCRRVGRFRVRGHRGVNRVRVPDRVGREPLAPGTYRVVARAIPAGRTVGRARLVVVDRASRGEIRAARRADSCAQGSSVGTSDPARPPAGALSVPARPKSARHPARHHGVLGARFGKVAFFAARRRSALGLRPARLRGRAARSGGGSPQESRPWACPRRSCWVS